MKYAFTSWTLCKGGIKSEFSSRSVWPCRLIILRIMPWQQNNSRIRKTVHGPAVSLIFTNIRSNYLQFLTRLSLSRSLAIDLQPFGHTPLFQFLNHSDFSLCLLTSSPLSILNHNPSIFLDIQYFFLFQVCLSFACAHILVWDWFECYNFRIRFTVFTCS
jgi:hypothetical protein